MLSCKSLGGLDLWIYLCQPTSSSPDAEAWTKLNNLASFVISPFGMRPLQFTVVEKVMELDAVRSTELGALIA